MELPQTIESTSASATVSDTVATAPERRKFKRYPVELHAYVVGVPFPERSDAYWDFMRPDSDPAIITNLSGTGLYFNSRANFEISDQVWVAMSLEGDMLPVRAVVVHRHEFKDDNDREYYGFGVQFMRSDFAATAVAAVLRYLNVLRATERRRAAKMREPE